MAERGRARRGGLSGRFGRLGPFGLFGRIGCAGRIGWFQQLGQRALSGLVALPGLVALSAGLGLCGWSGVAANPLAQPGATAGRSADVQRLGQPVDAATAAAQDLTVFADGRGLPPGRGSVAQGALLYAAQCAACHGAQGQGAPDGLNGGRLVGRAPLLRSPWPDKTIGQYWPQASTLFDYLRRAMPLQAPGSLQPDEVYALTAWLLHANAVIDADAVLDRQSLPAVRMPNRDGFVRGPR